ncbi:hypothetical protein NIES2111_22170 [Nostoc sp. NIES-2111]|nr:hypothetical protein NIES2111_22170 [Nostoc sp. NIES-2111]
MVEKMKNFKNWGRGVALASSTLALGSALAVSSSISSAQAATILGGITIVGGATIGNVTDPSPVNDTISFTAPFTTVPPATGILSGLIANSISTINLTRAGAASGTSTPYSATIGEPFISFSDGSVFVANNPADATRTFDVGPLGNNVIYNLPQLQGGFFSSSGDFLAQGLFSATRIGGNGADAGFSFNLSVSNVGIGQPVPEPATTGALAALGIGALFTNNVVKKKKVKINA